MTRRRILIAVAILVFLPFVLVAAAIMVLESAWAEGWVERRASAALGREVEIDDVDIRLGWPPSVNLARLRIGNPPWAKTPNLIEAEGLHANVEVAPLLRKKFVIPYLAARKASAGLEINGERATWRFGGPEDDRGESPIVVSRVQLEEGAIVFRDANEKTELDITVKGSLGPEGELKLAARGRFRDEEASGTATVPSLEPSPQVPIELVVAATIGRTKIAAKGNVASSLDSLQLDLQLAGQSLQDLRKVFRANLPDTPPYRIAGNLRHTGNEWHFNAFTGKVGDSDVRGDVIYRTGGKRRFFQADIKSKLLDLDDLGPIIGAPPKTGPGETAAPEQKQKAAALAARERILPDASFDPALWSEMDADVKLEAQRVLRPKQLPVDALSTHLVLQDSVLRLQPLRFGVAGGRITTTISIDGRNQPARGEMQMDVQGLQLARLFPEVEGMKRSLGTLYGRGKLVGRGQAVSSLLGSSNGELTFAVDGGRVSLLLVELLGLDLAEAVSLLGTRNRQVVLRCAVADLVVKDGMATPEGFIIDTTDTVVMVTGPIDLKREQIDLVFRPEPKDPSIFALRSPIHLKGPFKDPDVRPEAGPIAARVAGAVLLAAINPVLALLPFIETGPGKDSDCAKSLADVRAKGAVRKQ